jgi:hypothetical protein
VQFARQEGAIQSSLVRPTALGSSPGAASTPCGNWGTTPWRRPLDQPLPRVAVSPVVDVAAGTCAATAAGALVPSGPIRLSGGNPLLRGTPTHDHVTGALSPRAEISLGAPQIRRSWTPANRVSSTRELMSNFVKI